MFFFLLFKRSLPFPVGRFFLNINQSSISFFLQFLLKKKNLFVVGRWSKVIEIYNEKKHWITLPKNVCSHLDETHHHHQHFCNAWIVLWSNRILFLRLDIIDFLKNLPFVLNYAFLRALSFWCSSKKKRNKYWQLHSNTKKKKR
jgi:hypothetical protein